MTKNNGRKKIIRDAPIRRQKIVKKCNPCRAFLQAPSGKVYSSADGYTFVGDEYTFVVDVCIFIGR